MKKYINIIKHIFKCKYTFVKPQKKSLVLFDGESIKFLFNILNDFDYTILEVRLERIKKFYIHPKIIIFTLKNLRLTKNFYDAYLLAILDTIDPKVVFTFIDNSFKFSKFAELKQNRFQFIALQNGARYEHQIFDELYKKKLLKKKIKLTIPHFLCFGKHETIEYNKLNYNINKYTTVGSLKLSNYLNTLKKNHNFKTNDILLVSDVYCWDEILDKLKKPIAYGVAKLIKFSINYAMKKNLSIKIATRNYKNSFKEEKKFYMNNLSKDEFNFLSKNLIFRGDMFKIYKEMEKSKIVVGTMSTTLRENLSLYRKTLICNFTGSKAFNPPIQGLCFLKKGHYTEFEKRLNLILSISNKKYFKTLSKDPNYLVNNLGKETFNRIKSYIQNYL
jgi:surface carbohydrate biosynthesis protein